MRITKEEVKKLPDGTELCAFLSGTAWDNEFGKSVRVFKFKNQLMQYRPLCQIEDIDSEDDLDIQVAIKK